MTCKSVFLAVSQLNRKILLIICFAPAPPPHISLDSSVNEDNGLEFVNTKILNIYNRCCI
jgi:hypothetical protein